MSRRQDLGSDLLLKAYAAGVFPMAEDRNDSTLYWMDPDLRGIMPLDRFHVPKRLARTIRQNAYDVRIDTDFPRVIAACAAPMPGRRTTWINHRILDLYCELYDRGYAHSVEVWRDNMLIGGLYGVSLGAAFFGESMFSLERDVSKIALVHLVARLIAGQYTLLDAQYLTEHLSQFGTVEVPRMEYRRLLRKAVAAQGDFFTLPTPSSSLLALQTIAGAKTQSSKSSY